MALHTIFDNLSSIMTLISFLTFCGILLWTFALKRGADFERQAALPFADESTEEKHHG